MWTYQHPCPCSPDVSDLLCIISTSFVKWKFNVSILYYEDKVWVDDQTFSVSERSSSCAPSSPSGARRTRPAAGAFCLATCSTLTGENINVDSSLDLVNIIGPAKVSWWHKWQMLTPGTAAAQTSCQVPALVMVSLAPLVVCQKYFQILRSQSCRVLVWPGYLLLVRAWNEGRLREGSQRYHNYGVGPLLVESTYYAKQASTHIK